MTQIILSLVSIIPVILTIIANRNSEVYNIHDKELLEKLFTLNNINHSKITEMRISLNEEDFISDKELKKLLQKELSHLEATSFTTSIKINKKKYYLRKIKNEIVNSKSIENKSENNNAISSYFLQRKLKKIYQAYYLLAFCGLISVGLNFLFSYSLILAILLISIVILVLTYHQILKFRVKSGLFGSNYYEAKEMISFILENDSKFNDGNKVFHKESINKFILDINNVMQEKREEKLEW